MRGEEKKITIFLILPCVIYRPRETKKDVPTVVYHHSRRENCFQAQLHSRHPLQKKMLNSKIEKYVIQFYFGRKQHSTI